MSMIAQAVLLLAVCLVSEAVVRLIPLPIPGNVVGMALLFTLLQTGVVKAERIRRITDVLLSNMTILFVPSGAAIIVHYTAVSGHWPGFLATVILSSLLTLLVTGRLAESIRRRKQEK